MRRGRRRGATPATFPAAALGKTRRSSAISRLQGLVRGGVWPGMITETCVIHPRLLLGAGRAGAAGSTAEAARLDGTRRRARGSAVLGTGEAATVCVCARSTTGSQNRDKARRSAAAEILSWRICGTRGGDSPAKGTPASSTAHRPQDLAQPKGQGRVPLTGGLDRTEMCRGGFVGEDQRSRRAALAEKSPGDASGLLDLMIGRGRLR